eukprot:3197237-Rhodomonas_salina.1
MWSPEAPSRFTMLEDPADPDAMDAASTPRMVLPWEDSREGMRCCALGGELMSHNTYENIVHNKANIDYCIDQFAFVSSRINNTGLDTQVRPGSSVAQGVMQANLLQAVGWASGLAEQEVENGWCWSWGVGRH